MQIFVGTSGWFYDWNDDRTLDWYIKESQLNAIELNASFYRFPFPNQVKFWAKKGKSLRWAIKVNRLITHQYKFSDKGYEIWERFHNLLSIMDDCIDYYLFQLPPIITSKLKDKIALFIDKSKINRKFALEPRNESWFNDKIIRWAESLAITLVSVDAPEFPRTIFNTTKNVYLRMHGRTDWYAHNYAKQELKDIAKNIYSAKPEKVYVFFNNDHNMLNNAQQMMRILTGA